MDRLFEVVRLQSWNLRHQTLVIPNGGTGDDFRNPSGFSLEPKPHANLCDASTAFFQLEPTAT
jgi:hypothetical protein